MGYSSEAEPQCELQLTGSERIRGPSQARRDLIIGRKSNEAKGLGRLNELHHISLQSVIGDGHLLVISIQQIERFGYEIQLHSFVGEQGACHAQVRGCVVRSDQRIAPYAGKAVVFAVAILIRISRYHDVEWPPAAYSCDSRKLPSIH